MTRAGIPAETRTVIDRGEALATVISRCRWIERALKIELSLGQIIAGAQRRILRYAVIPSVVRNGILSRRVAWQNARPLHDIACHYLRVNNLRVARPSLHASFLLSNDRFFDNSPLIFFPVPRRSNLLLHLHFLICGFLFLLDVRRRKSRCLYRRNERTRNGGKFHIINVLKISRRKQHYCQPSISNFEI